MRQGWLQLAGLRYGGGDSYEHGNKVTGSAMPCEFIDQLNKAFFPNSSWLYEECLKML